MVIVGQQVAELVGVSLRRRISRADGVRKVSSKDIAGIELKTAAALVNRKSSRLVVAKALILPGLDEGNLRKGNSSLGLRGVKAQRVGRYLVDVRERRNVVGMVAVVRRPDADSLPQIPLQREVPLLHDRVSCNDMFDASS